MTSSRRVAVAFVLSVVGVACATSTAPVSGDGTQEGPGGGDGGIVDAAGGYGWGGEGGGGPTSDSGTTIVHKDSGTVTPIDSGTVTPPVDSGTTTTPEFCSGSTSSYDGSSYTSWCTYDYDYLDTSGSTFACASNDDCQSFGPPGCCFQPKSSSNCYKDYGGTPQCVPQ
jgi:hypothetical protein